MVVLVLVSMGVDECKRDFIYNFGIWVRRSEYGSFKIFEINGLFI